MSSETEGDNQDAQQEQAVPVCLRCLEPVDPLDHYCPHCGAAVGQLTPYIPFVNIRWQVGVWGDMWRGVRSRRVSAVGKVFRVLMIAYFMPILLIGVIPLLWRLLHRRKR